MSATKLLDVTFNACAANLQQVRRLVERGAARAGCREELVARLVLVLDEACANVIRHGYRGDRSGPIRLRLWRRGERLEFQLRDHAAAVDPACLKPRSLDECRPGGLGLNFIDSVMDDWEFRRPAEGRGNILYMCKKIEP